jgi:hypothetical protein
MTGIAPVFGPLFYKGREIIVLDPHQRLPFNFALNLPSGYTEFRKLATAKKFIRSL